MLQKLDMLKQCCSTDFRSFQRLFEDYLHTIQQHSRTCCPQNHMAGGKWEHKTQNIQDPTEGGITFAVSYFP